MQPRHRPHLDVAHAVADHHLRPVFERRDEARDLLEVVRQVGVGHHDVAAPGGGKAGQVGAAVAAAALDDNARASLLGKPRRFVLGGVVRDHYLAVDAHQHDRVARRRHALLDVPGLVQAGNDNRHERRDGVPIIV